jgi:hypothetical protein
MNDAALQRIRRLFAIVSWFWMQFMRSTIFW